MNIKADISNNDVSNFLVVFLCVCSFFPGNIFAEEDITIESALEAVKKENYEAAYREFQFLANKGEADAQHNLAMMYRLGKGVKKDFKISGEWFRKAADQGVVDAQYYMGHIYDTGEGVEKNKKYAFVWYRKAAEHGHGLAQINLGVQYANGLGVEQDVEQAYLWFHVAAAQGYRLGFENKKIIEESMKPEAIEVLKKKAQEHFKTYVLPYQRHSLPYSRLQ